jgi:hypothetical protein
VEKGGQTYTISVHRFVGVSWKTPEIFVKVSEIAVSIVMTFYRLMILGRLVYVW